jgi:hypothetical protein
MINRLFILFFLVGVNAYTLESYYNVNLLYLFKIYYTVYFFAFKILLFQKGAI